MKLHLTEEEIGIAVIDYILDNKRFVSVPVEDIEFKFNGEFIAEVTLKNTDIEEESTNEKP
jgi:hypothetical protein